MSRHLRFDVDEIRLEGLFGRRSLLHNSQCWSLNLGCKSNATSRVAGIAREIVFGNATSPLLVFLGAHPIKLGLSRYLIDLVGWRLLNAR